MALKQKQLAKLQFPLSTVDHDVPFIFNLYQFRFSGLLFLFVNLGIPTAALFIIRFTLGFGTNGSGTGALISILINLACFIFSMFYFIKKDSELFMKSGLFIFYAFQILIPLVIFLFGGLGSTIIKDETWKKVWLIGLQLLIEVFIIFWAFKSILDLKKRIKTTFQKDWRKLLIEVFGAIVVLFAVSMLYGIAVKGTVLGGDSENQKSLTDQLKTGNQAAKVVLLIVLAVFTMGAAPLVEELATRQAWYVGSGNRTVAWLTAPFFFALIHVSAGDVEHFLNYLIAGFILSSVFNLSRGNVTHSWLTHVGYNTLSYIVLVSML